MYLWSKEVEKRFFEQSFKFASPEQLFYVSDNKRYLAYWPKNYEGKRSTLQNRNSLIGKFTEKWTADLIRETIANKNLFVIQSAKCEELGLTTMSPADVIISKSESIEQRPEDILVIFEVKMSIVWNWELRKNNLSCLGDYTTHSGNPGLLRSDSMLKGIGKSINIRVSSFKASRIPIIIIGNTPITQSYYGKVDHLKIAGIVQGFWSVNPNPLENDAENIKETKKGGFYRFNEFEELKKNINSLLSTEMNFFSSMKNKKELGQIIELSNKEFSYEKKAEKFLDRIKETK